MPFTSIDTTEPWIWPKTQPRLTSSNLRGNCTIGTVWNIFEPFVENPQGWHCLYLCSNFRKPWIGGATWQPGDWCGRPPTRQRPCGTANQRPTGSSRTIFVWLDSITCSSSASQPRLATSDQKGVRQFASSQVGSQPNSHMQRWSKFSKLSFQVFNSQVDFKNFSKLSFQSFSSLVDLV